jgi:signal transduction histidine kinase
VLHYRLHLALWYGVTLAVVLHFVVVGGYGLVLRHTNPDVPGWGVFAPIAIPAILVISAGLGWWLAWRAVRPLQLITRAARDIGEGGDLSRRINLKGRDELSQLAATFDHMMDRLEGAFQRQREFTADASHELRTPVTIIGLEANRALAHERSGDEYRAALETIRAENDRMAKLVTDLLTLARSDNSQIQLGREDLDLGELVLDAVGRLEPYARRSGITLLLGDAPELAVNGDGAYLLQLLTNLLDNAVKYTTGVGNQVNVMAGQRESAGRQVAWVRVTDNGPGIPVEHLSRLFDRFYRVSSSRAQEREEGAYGHGLGLAIARWVARAHDGDVTVQSTSGVGSTFELTLPLRQQSLVEPSNRAS